MSPLYNEVLDNAAVALKDFVSGQDESEGVTTATQVLTDVPPVDFDPQMVEAINLAASNVGLTSKRMISGASHDAQLMASVCPTAMIFIPSKDGISHDIREFSSPEDCVNGANVLLQAVMNLVGQ